MPDNRRATGAQLGQQPRERGSVDTVKGACVQDGDDCEYITTERVGLVTYALLNPRGGKHTTLYFARLTGIGHEGAWRILTKLSRVLPVCRDPDGWFMLPED